MQFERWQAILLNQIRKDANWACLVNMEWAKKAAKNRGLTKIRQGQTVAQQCSDIDKCLSHISHYGPINISREINKDATSLNYMWNAIWDWAQIKTIRKPHLTYHDIRRSYDPETISHQDFFHKLLHAKEDCLLTARGNIDFKGAAVTIDTDLTPCN